MPNLQDRLDEFKKTFDSGSPPYNAPHEAIETMHRATANSKHLASQIVLDSLGSPC